MYNMEKIVFGVSCPTIEKERVMKYLYPEGKMKILFSRMESLSTCQVYVII